MNNYCSHKKQQAQNASSNYTIKCLEFKHLDINAKFSSHDEKHKNRSGCIDTPFLVLLCLVVIIPNRGIVEVATGNQPNIVRDHLSSCLAFGSMLTKIDHQCNINTLNVKYFHTSRHKASVVTLDNV